MMSVSEATAKMDVFKKAYRSLYWKTVLRRGLLLTGPIYIALIITLNYFTGLNEGFSLTNYIFYYGFQMLFFGFFLESSMFFSLSRKKVYALCNKIEKHIAGLQTNEILVLSMYIIGIKKISLKSATNLNKDLKLNSRRYRIKVRPISDEEMVILKELV